MGHLSQKTRQEKLSKLIKIFELYQVFMHNFLCQNDKIFLKIFELYQVFVWQNVSVKIGSISFFSSSDMQKLHHLLGKHAIDIKSSLIFFKCLAFFKFTMPSQKSDKIFIHWQKKLSWLVWKLKQYAWQKSCFD